MKIIFAFVCLFRVSEDPQFITMNILMNILYTVTLIAIRVWRLFIYIVSYIAFKPIKAYLTKILNEMGIGTCGTEAHNMVVHNDWLYHRMVCDGTLGLGEAYMDGWWDCGKLDEFFYKAFQAGIYQKLLFPWDRLIHYLKFDVFNLQTVVRSQEVADKHYDLGKIRKRADSHD